MYIIIVGGGRVGYYLTKALLDEGHEVLIVEQQSWVCATINEEMGIVSFCGDGCEAATLAEVGTGRADMFVAVTGDDEDNLVACQLAKHKFSVPRTIARIRNPRNKILFNKLGVDVTVSSTDIILESIEQEVPTHPLTHLLTIRDKGLEIVDIRIPPDSITVGKSIKELALPPESVLSLVIRKARKPIVPTNNTVLGAEVHVIAVTPSDTEEALRAVLRGD